VPTLARGATHGLMPRRALIGRGRPSVARVVAGAAPIRTTSGIGGMAVARREPVSRAGAPIRLRPGRSVPAGWCPALPGVHLRRTPRTVRLSRPVPLARLCGPGLPGNAAEAISAVALGVDGAAGLAGGVPLPVCGVALPMPAGSPDPVRRLTAVGSLRLARTAHAIEQPETHVPHS
jgi:hypothetical protein